MTALDSAIAHEAPVRHIHWEKPKDRHQLLADKLGMVLRCPGDLPCLGCERPKREHNGSTGACSEFVWDVVEEDPDSEWDRLKDERAFGNKDAYESGEY